MRSSCGQMALQTTAPTGPGDNQMKGTVRTWVLQEGGMTSPAVLSYQSLASINPSMFQEIKVN